MAQAATDMQRVMDTIAKLKGLAERPGSPEEAANATEKISRLMLRYNLTEAEVSTASRDTRAGYEKITYDVGAQAMWRHVLLNHVAESHFCTVVSGQHGVAWIIGQRHNAAVVTGLYEFLYTEVERLADAAWEEHKGDTYTTARKWKFAFRNGAVQTVGIRLRAMMQEMVEQEEGASALVLVKDGELQDAVTKYFPRLQRRTSNRRIDPFAYGAGQRAGGRINLAKQIG